MSDFFGKLKSGAGKVAFEADKMARLNKAQSDASQVKRQIEADYLKLGEMYYLSFTSQQAPNEAFAELCQHITELQGQLTVKNEEVARINAEQYNPQGAAPQPAAPQQTPTPQPVATPPIPQPSTWTPSTPETSASSNLFDSPSTPSAPITPSAPAPETAQARFCPSCGKQQPAATKFCTDCGARMM